MISLLRNKGFDDLANAVEANVEMAKIWRMLELDA